MRIVEDLWLTAVMERAVFRIELGSAALDDAGTAALVREHARSQRAAMYWTKVDTARAGDVRALGAAGLSVVDTNTTFRLRTADYAPGTWPAAIDVGELAAEHAGAVLDIAGRCFRYSRFHLDPVVTVPVAHRVKRAWIASYVNKERGDALLVALDAGRPAGFLAALTVDAGDTRAAVIDLVGVDEPFRRRGIGQALVHAFVARYGDRYDALRVGTQVANVPSIRLYEKLGFRLEQSRYVMHMHGGG